MPNKLIIFVVIILSVVMAGVFIFYSTSSPQTTPTPTVSPTGEQSNLIRVTEPVSSQTVEPSVSGDCQITGCSGQICSDDDVITTCEYKEEYVCYKTAKCERQEDGKCGWTPTEELVACLGAAFQAEEN